MKKKVMAVLLSVAMVAALIGCGSSNEPAPKEEAPAEEEEVAPEEAAEEVADAAADSAGGL